ncbi:hypothetical protein Tco_1344263 [Tanacetum coccineum]
MVRLVVLDSPQGAFGCGLTVEGTVWDSGHSKGEQTTVLHPVLLHSLGLALVASCPRRSLNLEVAMVLAKPCYVPVVFTDSSTYWDLVETSPSASSVLTSETFNLKNGLL